MLVSLLISVVDAVKMAVERENGFEKIVFQTHTVTEVYIPLW
jgi:hypothetical protein